MVPAVILVRPQLAENIGKAARAMLNFGLDDLRLVAPRDGWPNPDAGPAAIGADRVIEAAKIFDSLEAAIADLTVVYAATVRPRGMLKPVLTPAACAEAGRAAMAAGGRVGLIFGPERAGLDNDDVALADAVLTIPVDPECPSINLAQAVNIAAYEWFKTGDRTAASRFMGDYQGPAPKSELLGLFQHLESELDARNYFFPANRAPVMRRNLRNIIERAALSSPEILTLRGVIKTLARRQPRKGDGNS
ncbi:MAG: RNA methyltransferase [Sphingomonadales bacterium]